jgi:hypothetical protein
MIRAFQALDSFASGSRNVTTTEPLGNSVSRNPDNCDPNCSIEKPVLQETCFKNIARDRLSLRLLRLSTFTRTRSGETARSETLSRVRRAYRFPGLMDSASWTILTGQTFRLRHRWLGDYYYRIPHTPLLYDGTLVTAERGRTLFYTREHRVPKLLWARLVIPLRSLHS